MTKYDEVRTYFGSLIEQRQEALERDAEATARSVVRFYPRHSEQDIAAGIRLHAKHDAQLAALEALVEAVDRVEADDVAVRNQKQAAADDLARRITGDELDADEIKRHLGQVLERLRRTLSDGQAMYRAEQIGAALRGRPIDERMLSVIRLAASTKRDIGLDRNRALAFLRAWETPHLKTAQGI